MMLFQSDARETHHFNSRFWSVLTRICRLAAMLGWLGLSSAKAADAQRTCLVLEAEGKVDVARKGSTAWTRVAANDKLQSGDRLRTGMRSRATLRWSELSVLRLSELTSMEIQPPPAPGKKAEL